MNTLSTAAKIINTQGNVEARGVTVIAHDATATRCATIQINATEHRADECDITETTIKHKFAGWVVTL
jgi:hypothetical protein